MKKHVRTMDGKSLYRWLWQTVFWLFLGARLPITVCASDAWSVDLAAGSASAEAWTCDFSTDYVRINADYRS